MWEVCYNVGSSANAMLTTKCSQFLKGGLICEATPPPSLRCKIARLTRCWMYRLPNPVAAAPFTTKEPFLPPTTDKTKDLVQNMTNKGNVC